MAKFYAQLNDDNMCVSVLSTHKAIIKSNMIELSSFERERLGMTYLAITEAWEDTPPLPIRTITTQAFFRRLTRNERATLRTAALDEVADLREDLQRSISVDLDGAIEQQLLDTRLLSQTRIRALLADGTVEESQSGN